jgi:hypothetical protein
LDACTTANLAAALLLQGQVCCPAVHSSKWCGQRALLWLTAAHLYYLPQLAVCDQARNLYYGVLLYV